MDHVNSFPLRNARKAERMLAKGDLGVATCYGLPIAHLIPIPTDLAEAAKTFSAILDAAGLAGAVTIQPLPEATA